MTPAILLLTGAVAAGKNTIAHHYVTSFAQGADIDADLVQWMQRKPHHALWDQAEIAAGYPSQKLKIKHTTMLARSFIDTGFQVVITDVVPPSLMRLYRDHLREYRLRIVKLMPTWDVSLSRLHQRPPTISDDEARYVYDLLEQLTDIDYTIDNSHQSPQEVVSHLMAWMASQITDKTL